MKTTLLVRTSFTDHNERAFVVKAVFEPYSDPMLLKRKLDDIIGTKVVQKKLSLDAMARTILEAFYSETIPSPLSVEVDNGSYSVTVAQE